jgi:hypothetical protein
MSPQLSYAEQAPAFAGMLSSQTEGYDIVSGALGGATNVPFGNFLLQSVGEPTGPAAANPGEGTPPIFVLPAAAPSGNGAWRNGGLFIQSHEYDKRLDLDVNGSLLPTRQLALLRRGRAWVLATTAMGMGDDVYVRYTANGALNPGTIGNTADSAKAAKLFGARVVTPITAPGLCEIEIDMQAYAASSASQ